MFVLWHFGAHNGHRSITRYEMETEEENSKLKTFQGHFVRTWSCVIQYENIYLIYNISNCFSWIIKKNKKRKNNINSYFKTVHHRLVHSLLLFSFLVRLIQHDAIRDSYLLTSNLDFLILEYSISGMQLWFSLIKTHKNDLEFRFPAVIWQEIKIKRTKTLILIDVYASYKNEKCKDLIY